MIFSLRFLLSLVSIETIYQTLKTIFDHITKHFEVGREYSATRPISTLFSMFGNVAKHGLSCLTYFLKLHDENSNYLESTEYSSLKQH